MHGREVKIELENLDLNEDGDWTTKDPAERKQEQIDRLQRRHCVSVCVCCTEAYMCSLFRWTWMSKAALRLREKQRHKHRHRHRHTHKHNTTQAGMGWGGNRMDERGTKKDFDFESAYYYISSSKSRLCLHPYFYLISLRKPYFLRVRFV